RAVEHPGCCLVVELLPVRRQVRSLKPMSRPEALAEMESGFSPSMHNAGDLASGSSGIGFGRCSCPSVGRKWKLSTASTTGDRISRDILRMCAVGIRHMEILVPLSEVFL